MLHFSHVGSMNAIKPTLNQGVYILKNIPLYISVEMNGVLKTCIQGLTVATQKEKINNLKYT